MAVLHGSCLCGGVRFEIHGPMRPPRNCYCTNCRKQHAAPFRSAARVRVSDWKWVQGEELVRFFESSPGSLRGFCSTCGSAILNKFDERSLSARLRPAALLEYGFALGLLDDDPGVRPEYHLFVQSKAPWYEISDALPQYPELPPL